MLDKYIAISLYFNLGLSVALQCSYVYLNFKFVQFFFLGLSDWNKICLMPVRLKKK